MFRFFVRAPPNISFTCRFATRGLPVVSRGVIIPVQGYQFGSIGTSANSESPQETVTSSKYYSRLMELASMDDKDKRIELVEQFCKELEKKLQENQAELKNLQATQHKSDEEIFKQNITRLNEENTIKETIHAAELIKKTQENDPLQKDFFELQQKRSQQINDLVKSNEKFQEEIKRNKEELERNKEELERNKEEIERNKERITKLENEAKYIDSLLIVANMISRFKRDFRVLWIKETKHAPLFKVFNKFHVAMQTPQDKQLINKIMGDHFCKKLINKFDPIIHNLVRARNKLSHPRVAVGNKLNNAVEFLAAHEKFQGEHKNPADLYKLFVECSLSIYYYYYTKYGTNNHYHQYNNQHHGGYIQQFGNKNNQNQHRYYNNTFGFSQNGSQASHNNNKGRSEAPHDDNHHDQGEKNKTK